ncbi:hypothetical protein GIS00_02360 [Nakamurella sp. YIM 132087]|uniref:LppP/LprE family lipoprotein n=1 Tax=Nakamurella alba TaxID=2665158 RepID=A0A7K1FFA8_9ACTN|nr:hypothetical protein [Nakamurella alba]MTD12787.1 hypothetical protein [Nakamurella alba]
MIRTLRTAALLAALALVAVGCDSGSTADPPSPIVTGPPSAPLTTSSGPPPTAPFVSMTQYLPAGTDMPATFPSDMADAKYGESMVGWSTSEPRRLVLTTFNSSSCRRYPTSVTLTGPNSIEIVLAGGYESPYSQGCLADLVASTWTLDPPGGITPGQDLDVLIEGTTHSITG